MTIMGLELREFPNTIKKGDVITIPSTGDSFKVVKTPKETSSHSCEVRNSAGKKMWQFAFKGILINGKALD